MKKFISLLFISIIIFSFSSCGNQDTNSTPEVKSREYRTDTYKVSDKFEIKTEKNVYSTDIESIKYFLINNSDSSAMSNFEIWLSKYIDGEWKIVSPEKDTVVEELAILVEANSSVPARAYLNDFYNLPLEPGKYRLVMPDYARSNTFTIE